MCAGEGGEEEELAAKGCEGECGGRGEGGSRGKEGERPVVGDH